MSIYLKNNGCSSINKDSPRWLFEASFCRVFSKLSRLCFMYKGEIINITTQTIFYCKSCILCTAFLTMSCTDANVVIPTKISMRRLYIPSICNIAEKLVLIYWSTVFNLGLNRKQILISLMQYSWNNNIHSRINLIIICAVWTLL